MVMERAGIRKVGWPLAAATPLVTTTGGNDLVHTLPIDPTTLVTRSARIVKILAYNNTGGNVTLSFGTLNRNPAGAAFVALLPTLVALNGIDNVWEEDELPAVEFKNDRTATALGRTGDIYVLASVANVLVEIEIVEYGS